MRRRAFCASVVGAASAVVLDRGEARAIAPAISKHAVIGYDILGTATRLPNARKTRGFSVIVEATAPNGVRPFDVSLFVQHLTASGWANVKPASDAEGNAYRSGLDQTAVDYAIVDAEKAAVSLFIPHEILSLPAGEVQLRFLLRLFAFNPQTGKYVVQPAFDKTFAQFAAKVSLEPRLRVVRRVGYGGINLPVLVYDLDNDRAVNLEANP